MPLTPIKTDPNYKSEKARSARQPETFGPDVPQQPGNRELYNVGGLVGDRDQTKRPK